MLEQILALAIVFPPLFLLPLWFTVSGIFHVVDFIDSKRES